MRRMIIVCEGPTEQEFCLDIIAPELIKYDITVEAPIIKHSNGGVVAWDTIKRQLIAHLHEGDVAVSMLIDYYGIKDSFKFPGWEESKSIQDKVSRMHFLFDAMENDLPSNIQNRFIPYIQLHEFEGLLFSNIDVILQNFDPKKVDFQSLKTAEQSFDNPELINNGVNTAPSKRLIKAIPDYSKVLYGNVLALGVTLYTMRQKCPLFNEWIERMMKIK